MTEGVENNNIRATNATIQAEIVALRDRLDLIWKNHEKEHNQHEASHIREHAFSQTAIDTASLVAKENKADANEWRAAMSDRELQFATKSDVSNIMNRLDKIERTALILTEREATRVREDADSRAEADRRHSRSQWTVGLVVGVLATFGAVLVNTIIRLAVQ